MCLELHLLLKWNDAKCLITTFRRDFRLSFVSVTFTTPSTSPVGNCTFDAIL